MAVKTVQSLQRGLEILHILAQHGPSLKLQEVTSLSGLHKATTYRLLQTLINQDYVHYFPETATFRPGPKVMTLGYGALAGLDLVEVCEPYLRDLSGRIGQNVNLGILEGVEIVYIIRIKVRRILNINLAVGSRLNAYNSAIGEALLAYLEPKKLDKVINELAEDPAAAREIGPDGAILREKLAGVRQRGYALTEGEFQLGLSSVAVPVMGVGGKVEGALNLPVFTQITKREVLLGDYLPELIKIGEIISTLRGYRSGECDEDKD